MLVPAGAWPAASRSRCSSACSVARRSHTISQVLQPVVATRSWPASATPVAFQASRTREPASQTLARALHAVGDQRRHGLGDGQRILGRFQQAAAALADVVCVLLIAGMAERAVQLAQHHLGEADHRIERRAQLVAHLRHQIAQAVRTALRHRRTDAGVGRGASVIAHRSASRPPPRRRSPSGRPGAAPASPAMVAPAASVPCQAVISRMPSPPRCSPANMRASHGVSTTHLRRSGRQAQRRSSQYR